MKFGELMPPVQDQQKPKSPKVHVSEARPHEENKMKDLNDQNSAHLKNTTSHTDQQEHVRLLNQPLVVKINEAKRLS